MIFAFFTFYFPFLKNFPFNFYNVYIYIFHRFESNVHVRDEISEWKVFRNTAVGFASGQETSN